jgi:hypothetical protein
MYRQKIKYIAAAICPKITSYDDKTNYIKTLQFDNTLSLMISILKQVNK